MARILGAPPVPGSLGGCCTTRRKRRNRDDDPAPGGCRSSPVLRVDSGRPTLGCWSLCRSGRADASQRGRRLHLLEHRSSRRRVAEPSTSTASSPRSSHGVRDPRADAAVTATSGRDARGADAGPHGRWTASVGTPRRGRPAWWPVSAAHRLAVRLQRPGPRHGLAELVPRRRRRRARSRPVHQRTRTGRRAAADDLSCPSGGELRPPPAVPAVEDAPACVRPCRCSAERLSSPITADGLPGSRSATCATVPGNRTARRPRSRSRRRPVPTRAAVGDSTCRSGPRWSRAARRHPRARPNGPAHGQVVHARRVGSRPPHVGSSPRNRLSSRRPAAAPRSGWPGARARRPARPACSRAAARPRSVGPPRSARPTWSE